jgi:hypothetical protein
MKLENGGKIAKLECSFPRLTEANQQYVLGVAEGLKYAQNRQGENPEKGALLPQDSGYARPRTVDKV